ncbi:hypothetical protein HDV04_005009 [Boothiomyces sp. JEL0838]|nr:hypothetical protein HDV04_005009 [Boothiomyces sp. JEL0838]
MKQFNSHPDQFIKTEGSSVNLSPTKQEENIPKVVPRSPERNVNIPTKATVGQKPTQPKQMVPKQKKVKQPSLSDIKQFIQSQRLKVEKERRDEKLEEIQKPLLFGKATPVLKKKEKKEFEVPAPARGNVSRSGLVSKERNYKTEFETMRDESDSRLMAAIRKQRLKELNEQRRLRSELEKKTAHRKSNYSATALSKSIPQPKKTEKVVDSPKALKKSPKIPSKQIQEKEPKRLSTKSSTDKIENSRIGNLSSKSNLSSPELRKDKNQIKEKSTASSPERTQPDNREIIDIILSQINSKLDPMLQSVQEHYIRTSNMIDQKLVRHINQAKEDETITIGKREENSTEQSSPPKPQMKPISVASKNIFGLYNEPKVKEKGELELTEYDLLCIPSPKPRQNLDQVIVENIEDTYPAVDKTVQPIDQVKPKSAFDLHEPKEIVIESHVEFPTRKITKTEGTSTAIDKERTLKPIILPNNTIERIINDKERRSKWLSVYFDYSESQPPWDAIESISDNLIKDMIFKISGEIEQFSNQYIDGLLEQELTIL